MVDSLKKKERKYKRILLKLSGEELSGEVGFGIDPKVLDKMALEIGPVSYTHLTLPTICSV